MNIVSDLKFLIIIPAHNEEKFILKCLQSIDKQNFQNFTCIIVNDGSFDNTQSLVENFIDGRYKFKILNLPLSTYQIGEKVVKIFYAGLESVDLEDFDIICKFDADIIFPENYLKSLNDAYAQNPNAGIVSGIVYIKNENGDWAFENLSSKNHVRGPIKSYNIKCFTDMNGLRPILGWDNIDVMLAKMYGWEVITLKNIWVKHLRPTSYRYKSQKAEKHGQYFYNIGLNLPLAIISSAKSSLKSKSISEFFITIKTFLKQKGKYKLSNNEIKYIRRLRWKMMFEKLKIK